MVFFEIVALLVSLAVLAKSSEVVVSNAAKLSVFFGISQLAIGFMLLAICTTLPELSVSVISSSAGQGEIAAGNVFGSNIANILLILGIGALAYGFKISKADIRDISIVLVVTTVLSAYIIYASLFGSRGLSYREGTVLLAGFGLYAYYILSKKKFEDGIVENVSKREAMGAFLMFFGSILVVLLSAGIVVQSSVQIANDLGLAQSFIGATIVSIGTALPELSIDLQAIRRKHYGLAIGDAIGSNMANLTLVLGTASVINTIPIVLPIFTVALLYAIVANVLLFYIAAVDKRLHTVGGALFLATYVVYLALMFALQVAEKQSVAAVLGK
jgi:cation:H+ antiporter